MEKEKVTFKMLSLRPHWTQYIINHLHWMALCLATVALCRYTSNGILHPLLCIVAICLLVYLIYQLVYLQRMSYIITDDQIIYQHGIISHSTDYMELYRVIDYQQQRSLLQQMVGLKTVIIYSGDRNTPVMQLIGMRQNDDVVKEIRRRVEHNKELKHIYEITNRM